MTGILHFLYSPKAEGCPRLALQLLRMEEEQLGRQGLVTFCVPEPTDLVQDFRHNARSVDVVGWSRRGLSTLLVRFLRLMRRRKPDGIVCYTIGQHVAVAIAAWLLRIPIVLHIGNGPPLENPTAVWKIRMQLRFACRFVTAYAACSDYVRDAVIAAYGLDPSKVHSIPNGIDLSQFKPRLRAENRDTAAPIQIGMVGSLEMHKDYPTLLRAFAELVKSGTDARLWVIGDGSRRQELQQLAGDLGIAPLVNWTGNVNDVGSYLRKLDVFAFSVADNEGLGIALIEALATGVPVVAADVPACREVLEGERLGILVPARDPLAWSRALLRAAGAHPPAQDHLTRYDIRTTFRAYRSLLGEAA